MWIYKRVQQSPFFLSAKSRRTIASIAALSIAQLAAAAFADPPSEQKTPPLLPAAGISIGSYPRDALRHGDEGTVRFEAVIGKDGSVRSCAITQSSGHADLDQATCDAIRQVRGFTPATNVRGAVIEGSYSSAIRWVIPKQNVPPAQSALVYSFIVDKNGLAHHCKLIRAEGPAAAKYAAGAMPCDLGKYDHGYVGADGKPAPKRVVVTQSLTIEDIQ